MATGSLDRLRDMSAGTRLSVACAARRLHVLEVRKPELVRWRGGADLAPDAMLSTATLRFVVRRAHDAQTGI